MLRGVTVTLVTSGVLLCPVFCMGESNAARASSVFSCSCSASPESACDCERSPCDSGRPSGDPSPADDPCRSECVCKGLVEGFSKPLLTSAELWLPVHDDPLSTRIVAFLSALREACRDKSPTHPDLSSGVAIRVAFASFLL